MERSAIWEPRIRLQGLSWLDGGGANVRV